MRDLIPEWIADTESLQEMPLELSADIDAFLDGRPGDSNALELQGLLADRHAALQGHIESLRAASLSGSKVLVEEGN